MVRLKEAFRLCLSGLTDVLAGLVKILNGILIVFPNVMLNSWALALNILFEKID